MSDLTLEMKDIGACLTEIRRQLDALEEIYGVVAATAQEGGQ